METFGYIIVFLSAAAATVFMLAMAFNSARYAVWNFRRLPGRIIAAECVLAVGMLISAGFMGRVCVLALRDVL